VARATPCGAEIFDEACCVREFLRVDECRPEARSEVAKNLHGTAEKALVEQF
jgi:hypothetical protein